MQHDDYHYSVTVHTDDLALLGCLRAICEFAQVTGNARIASGGTSHEDWIRLKHQVTFRFTTASKRQTFLEEADRLLPQELWTVVGQREDDPAKPRGAQQSSGSKEKRSKGWKRKGLGQPTNTAHRTINHLTRKPGGTLIEHRFE